MTVLVDEAEWPWRGDKWAHLVSDVSAAELHVFANRLGLRRLAFQDDHYDVPTAVRDTAIELGARPVTSRVLVEALHDSGLRVRRRVPWNQVALDHHEVAPALTWLHRVWPETRVVGWSTPVALGARPGAVAGLAFTVPRPEGVILDVVLTDSVVRERS